VTSAQKSGMPGWTRWGICAMEQQCADSAELRTPTPTKTRLRPRYLCLWSLDSDSGVPSLKFVPGSESRAFDGVPNSVLSVRACCCRREPGWKKKQADQDHPTTAAQLSRCRQMCTLGISPMVACRFRLSVQQSRRKPIVTTHSDAHAQSYPAFGGTTTTVASSGPLRRICTSTVASSKVHTSPVTNRSVRAYAVTGKTYHQAQLWRE
jgi:hypothetical protein